MVALLDVTGGSYGVHLLAGPGTVVFVSGGFRQQGAGKVRVAGEVSCLSAKMGTIALLACRAA